MYSVEVFFCWFAIVVQHTTTTGVLFWKATKSQTSDPSVIPLFVTQHLESGAKVEDIQGLARVSLFGETHESYSGYITVNETMKSNLFFWFFKSSQESKERPVVLWLQGGPGDTFMTTFFGGNGPYHLAPDGPKLTDADVTWTRTYNMLYIDNPVGTGYSFTSHYKHYCKTLNDVAEHLYEALKQFFCIFPEFVENEFYLAGESYAGKYIPALTSVIHQKNNENNTCINLKGLFIGCGFIDPVNQFYYADNLYEFGIVDENKRDRIKCLETAVRENIKKENYYLADAILVSLAATILGIGYWPPIDILNPQIDATEYNRIMEFVNKEDVRKLLHVGTNEFLGKRMVLWNFRKDFLKSASSHLLEALKNYRVLLYSGQFDMLIPPMQIDKVVEALGWSEFEEFSKANRSCWYVDDDLAGYRKAHGNLTVIEVRKANHFILRSQPKWILELFTSFVNNTT